MTAQPIRRGGDRRGVRSALPVVAGFRPTRRRFQTWTKREPVLAGLSWETLQAVLLDRQVSHDRKDDLLAALVRLARNDSEAVAALMVCLSPGLRAAARRLVGCMDTEDGWAELHLGLCDRIARYDLERRPRRIAANLTADALRPLRKAVRSHVERQERTRPLHERPESTTEVEISARTILDLAQEAGVIAPIDVALVASTRLAGLTIRQAASLLGMDYELAKKRRQRAEPSLAHWWTTDTGQTTPDRPARLADVIPIGPEHTRTAEGGLMLRQGAGRHDCLAAGSSWVAGLAAGTTDRQP